MSRHASTAAAPLAANVMPTVQSRVVAGLHTITLLLLALHIYVRTLPPTIEAIPTPADAETAWWGLWPVTYVPPFWFWLGVAVVLLTLVWSWFTTRSAPTAISSLARNPLPARWHTSLPWLYALSALLFIAFYLWPIVHTRWGDAFILTQAIAWPDPALRLTNSWQAPLDVWLHSLVWHALNSTFDWQNATPVYHLLSPLAGALYLIVLLQLAADRSLAPVWLTYGLLATLGVMQLFFGYVENYSFAAAGILAFLWLGRRALHAQSRIWPAALVLGLTNATHPSTIVYGPALLYVAWRVWRRGTMPPLRVVVETALPPLLVAAGTLAMMEMSGHGIVALFTTDRPGGSDASWFVPLWGTRTRWETYTLLSWWHIRDLLNQMLLVAPVVLPSLCWLTSAARQTHNDQQQSTRYFLAIAAGAHLLLIAVWNPDYGGQRDWDLFSLAWIPTTLWLVSLARAKLHDTTLRAGFLPLIVLQALHTAAWIYQNTLPWDWP